MAIARRVPSDRYGACENYLVSRIRALTLKPADIRYRAKADNQVYGVVVDMPMGQNMLSTLVVFANGAANLYFNTGGGMVNAASKYKMVAQAAVNFTGNAGKCLSVCERTITYDLPTGGTQYFHLLTRRGVYKVAINPSQLKEEDKEKRVLVHLCQEVMNQLRIAQLKDKSESESRKA